MLKVVKLSVVMLNLIMLSVVMPSVVAPVINKFGKACNGQTHQLISNQVRTKDKFYKNEALLQK